MIFIEKYDPEKCSLLYMKIRKTKSFTLNDSLLKATERKMDFIGEEGEKQIELLTGDKYPRLDVAF